MCRQDQNIEVHRCIVSSSYKTCILLSGVLEAECGHRGCTGEGAQRCAWRPPQTALPSAISGPTLHFYPCTHSYCTFRCRAVGDVHTDGTPRSDWPRAVTREGETACLSHVSTDLHSLFGSIHNSKYIWTWLAG